MVGMNQPHSGDIKAFIATLPDARAAQVFLERLAVLHPERASLYRADTILLTRLVTVAAYSPFLAETLLRHPDYLDWLRREADLNRSKSVEELSQNLARFTASLSQDDVSAQLARFKRRELLRIYLRDCLQIATLAEITEELSNLADVLLDHSLALAWQEAHNRYGVPQTRDERGRISPAQFAIVALGKLGCRELNYASDIDLLFLYAGQGETSGSGAAQATAVKNQEFFTFVARRVTQLLGTAAGEGAVYRMDLRLRPYGRDGDLVWEIERAADYYRHKAQNWERQMLIRARLAAGSEAVFVAFINSVRALIFQPDALPDTLANVRKTKEKIDRQEAARSGGFNVKLGIGGIREIEFILQALQLVYGGREPWLRSAQTLIVLARLAEKGYLAESERAKLSAAYTFLRTVEHRLQMEQGAQTHRLPMDEQRLTLLARRCGYGKTNDPVSRFREQLETHTTAVRAIYRRVFIGQAEHQARSLAPPQLIAEGGMDDEIARVLHHATRALGKCLASDTRAATADQQEWQTALNDALESALSAAINPLRALRNLTQWAEALATYSTPQAQSVRTLLVTSQRADFLRRLLLILSSQYLANLLVPHPLLAAMLAKAQGTQTPEPFPIFLRASFAEDLNIAAKLDALRRAWCQLVIEIGYRDLSIIGLEHAESANAKRQRYKAAEGKSNSDLQPSAFNLPPLICNQQWITDERQQTIPQGLRANNLEQTTLAEATLAVALDIALQSLGVPDAQAQALPFAVLALGRLGHAGMDYGSDLDLLIVFDDETDWSAAQAASAVAAASNRNPATANEFYAKLTAELVRVLSSVTREGLLYNVDLRLRPDGKNGPLATSLKSLIAYLGQRASAWEHSAYLKAREVAGDLAFGKRARKAICQTSFAAAADNPALKGELAGIRARLEQEKARRGRPDIKWGRGGMTDVYFITRYLQLREQIYFAPEQGTMALIADLGARGVLSAESTRALLEGYGFLRRLDHWIRLLVDRPMPVLPASDIALRDIAQALGFDGAEAVERETAHHTEAIRKVYELTFA